MDDRDASSPEVEIRALRADEAAGLVACFRRCYGDSYVDRDFYDEASIRRRLQDGTLRSMVAVSPVDGIVGHMALTVRHPGGQVVDAGNTVVDPRHRGGHLAARLGASLVELCREQGFVGFLHYPTTAHPVMQKLAVQGGGIETGLVLGYIPSGTEYRDVPGASHAHRLAAIVSYQPIDPAPPGVSAVPRRYAAMLERLSRQCGLVRTFRAGTGALAAETDAQERFDPRRRLRRFEVLRAGRDLVQRVQRPAAEGEDADVEHVDLSLLDPAVDDAVEALRAEGFFFGALMPAQFAGDTLRLQRLRDADASVLRPQLATDGGRELLEFLTQDRGGRA